MTNEGSLLAHLSHRFTKRTEDIAVEALGYILSTSEAARAGLLSILRSSGAHVEELTRIATQVVGEGRERPDLVGWDENGDQRISVEAKFWAGLTPKQPNEYLRRLRRGGVLLFVAPEARLDALWPELERLSKQEFEWAADADGARTADVDGRHLILTSWRTLLEAAKHRAAAAGDSATVTSIQQLNGLCQQQDHEAFLPLRRNEFGPEFPRRHVNLVDAINPIVDRAKRNGIVSTKDLRATNTKYVFGRYIELGVREGRYWANDRSAGACLCLDYKAWSQYRETPLWLRFDEWEGVLPLEEVRKHLGDEIVVGKDGTDFVPIYLPTDVELDDVVDSVVARLRDLAHRLAGVRPN